MVKVQCLLLDFVAWMCSRLNYDIFCLTLVSVRAAQRLKSLQVGPLCQKRSCQERNAASAAALQDLCNSQDPEDFVSFSF